MRKSLIVLVMITMLLSACTTLPNTDFSVVGVTVSYGRPIELAKEEFETVFAEYEGLKIAETATLSRMDDAIDRQSNAFNEAVIIGEVIGRNMLGISDSLIHQRIESMIEKGYLEIERRADNSEYHRYLRKA